MTATLAARLTGKFATEPTPDCDEGNDYWPPPPDVAVHAVSGNLADRIRSRFGASATAPVVLTEEIYYGGHSEYTQENSTSFEIACAGRSVSFEPDASELHWHDAMERPEAVWDSVFSRFDSWLAVAEHPDKLFAEWFDVDGVERCDWWVAYSARANTVLWRSARKFAHHRIGELQLYKHPIGGYQDRTRKLVGGEPAEWILRFVEPVDDRGFRAVSTQVRLHLSGEATHRQLLEAVTDTLLPRS